MKTNKFWSFFFMLVLSLVSAVVFSSCNDDENSPLPSYVIDGCWIAETDGWYYYISFYEDGTFDYNSESKRGSEGMAEGTYTYNSSSHIISCTGYSGTVYSDGEVQSGEWKRDFKYDESNRLIISESSGIIYSKDRAYDNRDHSNDNLCDACGGSGRCNMCNNGTCTFCRGEGGEYDRYLGRWVDCRHCNNGACSYCDGFGNCTECRGKGIK